MTREDIKLALEDVLTPKRFIHSLGVMNSAVELAKRYGEDREKAATAGLLHDCARDIRGEQVFEECSRYGIEPDDVSRVQPELLHGPLGAEMVRWEYGIKEEDIIDAVRYHTTGCVNMTLLEKIIFIADCIEPNRSYPGVDELRRAAFNDIDTAMLLALDKTVKHVLGKGTLIHPDTISARNYIIFNRMKENGRYPRKNNR